MPGAEAAGIRVAADSTAEDFTAVGCVPVASAVRAVMRAWIQGVELRYRGGVGRYAGRGYGYRRAGYYGGRYYRGVGVGLGAAAVGAAAAGAYGAYEYRGGGCYTNSYGSWVCPGQYGYGY